MRSFDEYLNRIIDEYTSKAYASEVKKARKEFFDAIGNVHEDDIFFETYMKAFTDWYIFDRDIAGQDLPPARLYYRKYFKDLSPEEKEIYKDFTKYRHSFFIVKKVTPTSLLLQDLFYNEKIKIENAVPTIGFTAGDIFESIIIPYQSHLMFTENIFSHPPETKSFIKKEMKKIQNLDTKILLKTLLKLKRLKLKCDRYPHVHPLQIYNPEEFNRNA